MENPYRLFVGVDWGTQTHQVMVLDGDGKKRREFSAEHSAAGLERITSVLMELSDREPGQTAIAIETPRGAIVDTLMERGFAVYSINPKQSDRFRDRHSVAGAKDDRLDAFVLGDSLRTDRHCFRRVAAEDPFVIQIREVNRTVEHLKEDLSRGTNRLREQVYRIFPQLLELCPAANEPWFWSLLELAPTPQEGARLKKGRVRTILKKHRIRRWSADDVLRVAGSPAPYVAAGVLEAAEGSIALLLPRLVMLKSQRDKCEKRIESLLSAYSSEGEKTEHHDVEILLSLPGIGRSNAATMLSEASRPLASRDYQALRTMGGIAPVTRRSGKRATVSRRHSCNHRLREALYHWSRVSVQRDPVSAAKYEALRARGSTHGRALRTVADRLLLVLVRMLETRTLYDPSLRGSTPGLVVGA